MSAILAKMLCDLYKGAFSGEVVFAVETTSGPYEGVAPKHYAHSSVALSANAVSGNVAVRVISNGGKTATVLTPDGEILEVPAEAIAGH
jgi:hypothetical protein